MYIPVNWMLCFDSVRIGMAAACRTAYGHAHHGKFRMFNGALPWGNKREKDETCKINL